MNPAWLLPFSAAFPILLIGLLAFSLFGKHALRLLPLAPLPALAAAVLLPEGAHLLLPNTLLQASWTLDSTGRVFLFFSSLGWLSAGLFSLVYFRKGPHPGSFAIPFLLALSGNLALIGAADAVTFYSGFAVMSFASWGLVVHEGTPAARRAGRIYLALVVIGELMILPGIISGALRSGDVAFDALRAQWKPSDAHALPLFLLFFGFAIKAGLFPFHFWLPIAHPAAPTPASAVLSGCMINAGLLGIVRFLPIGRFPMPQLADILHVLSGIGIVGAPLIGLLQSNPKAMLAYSSVAKMSSILLLLVPALRDPTLAVPAIAILCQYAAFHGLHKTALFLGVAVTPGLPRLGWAVLLLLSASFVGFPGLQGAEIKSGIKILLAVGDASKLLPLLNLGAFLGSVLLLRFLWRTRPGSSSETSPPSLVLVWLLAIGLALLYPASLTRASRSFDPLLLGLVPVAALAWFCRRRALPTIHPGDWMTLLPPVPHFRLYRISRLFARAEQRLSAAQGGLFQLVLLLLLIAILSGYF